MRPHINIIDWISSVLIIIGALNWGSVGIFRADVVTYVFGVPFARVIFTLVGLAGLYMIYTLTKLARMERREAAEHPAR